MSERLEEIKEIFGVHKIQTFADRKTIPFNLDDIEWLIERVEKLEEERDEWKYTAQSYYMTNQELREQNKRYREALDFYADEETYETKFATDTDEIYDPLTLIELDNGEKARQALEGDNG